MENKKDQLLESIKKHVENPNMNKVTNTVWNVFCIASLISALAGMVAGYYKMAENYGDSPIFVVFKVIFIVVMIADVAFLLKQILQLILGVSISKMDYHSVNQKEYEELITIEKALRKTSLVCDLITELVRSSIAIAICLFFIIGGIYMGITGQEEDIVVNLMLMIVFPLMGITALIFCCEPLISIIKELFQTNDTDWETYNEKQITIEKGKKFHIADIKLVLFGAVFFFCGLLAFLSGFSQTETGQMIAMCALGLVFMVVGGSISYFLGIRGGQNGA